MTQQIDVVHATEADGYLQQPYARIILPESDGTFRGEIMEFPGCIAVGETAAETLTSLEEVAKDWLLAALERGQNIPQPVESSNAFSGRLVLRLPKSLHKKATWIAEREGVSLNQFIVASLAETVGERRASGNVFISISKAGSLQQFGKQLGHRTLASTGMTTLIFPQFGNLLSVTSHA
jgi:predicted HicB family RNase H-like nuclease